MQRKEDKSINEHLPAEMILHCLNLVNSIDTLAICACVCTQWQEQSTEAAEHLFNNHPKYSQILTELMPHINPVDHKKVFHYLEHNNLEKLKAIISNKTQEIELYYPSYDTVILTLFARTRIENLFLSQKSLEADTYNLSMVKKILTIKLPINNLMFKISDLNDTPVLKVTQNGNIFGKNITAVQQLVRR